MKTYDELFELRGSAYDRAMQRQPAARDEEFLQVVARVAPEPGMVVADVPAGGGYLKHYLPTGCNWWGHEPCASFTHHGQSDATALHKPLLPLPWRDATVDAAVSLAGVHHIEDKHPLFAELYRVVKPGGRLILSDVAARSEVAGFLDDYVGANNTTGHEGVYLDDRTVEELEAAGWTVAESTLERFHWVFADGRSMAGFCHELFDLCHSTLEQTAEAICDRLGVMPLPGGGVAMNWSLLTFTAVR